MVKVRKKHLITLACISGLAFSSAPYASVYTLGKLGKTTKTSMKATNTAARVQSIRSVSPAFKPVKATTTTYKPTLVTKNTGQLRMNQQRLAIQSNVKKNVDLAKKNLGIKGPASLRGQFGSNANPGLIYRRQMGKNVYIGQTKNLNRFPKRQLEHNRKLKKDMGAAFKKPSYQLVAGAPAGNARLLRVAEESAYRTQKQFGSHLTNKVSPMANGKYLSAIGR
jgi:hypothetical protein